MASDVRQSGFLPPIRSLDTNHVNPPKLFARSSSLTEPDLSPKSMIRASPNVHAPYPYGDPPSHHAVSSAAHALTTLGKRASSGERVDSSSYSPAARYSLPSLHEALGMDDLSPNTTAPGGVPSMPQPRSQPSDHSTSSATASHPATQNLELSSVRSDSNTSWATSRTQYTPLIHPASPGTKLSSSHRGSSSSSHYAGYPTEDTRQPYTNQSPNHRPIHRSSRDEIESPRYAVTSEPRQASFSANASHERPSSTWQAFNQQHNAEMTRIKTLKRHLGEFDLEQSLKTISEESKRLNDFSEYYRTRASQTSRSGPLPGSTPSIQEISDMIEHGSSIQSALNNLQEVIINQQAALAERSREQAAKPNIIGSEESPTYQDDSKDGGYAGSDAKRRRGRVAPPGRCHSCNRAETPEWRRGPDGARTLCNACGLHYAKLTRKMGTNKPTLANSSLRPKTVTSAASPVK